MRIISADYMGNSVADFIAHVKDGIILYGSKSLHVKGAPLTKEGRRRIMQATEEYDVSVIGTRVPRSTGYETVYVISNGKVKKTHVEINPFDKYWADMEYSLINGLNAIIRVSVDALEPCRVNDPADMLLVPYASSEFATIDELISLHQISLKPSALIVQSGKVEGQPIYNLRGDIVSIEESFSKCKYHIVDTSAV